ncbi:ADP-ribosylglycohydrolase family protein [Methanothrix sp.]|uniref:ADP-ribosylglycohydrolase family protein n=1 Tax=Methanothrix sp. TaxID=90426 RepID=UPI003BB4E4A9
MILYANLYILRRLLAGLAAGDSLGSTSEFMPQKDVPSIYHRLKGQGWPFRQVGGGVAGWMPGDPTDDTEMALCIIRSFIHEGKFNPQSIAQEFVSWMNSGTTQIGTTTLKTLKICEAGDPYWQRGFRFWQERPDYAANGSLMRNGVIVGMSESLNEAFTFTLKHGMITHYGTLPQICCMAQTYLIWSLLQGRGLPMEWIESFDTCLSEYFRSEDDPEIRAWLFKVSEGGDFKKSLMRFQHANWDMEEFNPFNRNYTRGVGYCLLTLQIAIWGLHWSLKSGEFSPPYGFPQETFEVEGPARLAWVAMIGHDADTYAAVAGALIAAAYPCLPTGFTDGLKALEYFDRIAGSLKQIQGKSAAQK